MAEDGVRLDRWLWAARFFKTRALAQQAIQGGKVRVNGHRAKPARAVTPGDRMTLTRGQERIELVVAGVAERRGPAPVAAKLYDETPESKARREAEGEERRLRRLVAPVPPPGRPDKRARRRIIRFTRRGESPE